MLNCGFANWSSTTPKIDPALITDVEVIMGEQRSITPQVPSVASFLIPKGREGDIVQDIKLSVSVEAPAESGQVLGNVDVSLDGETIGTYSLTAPHYIDRLSFATVYRRLLEVFSKT